MRVTLISVCTWILIATGTFLAASGALDYWESHAAQHEIAEEWDRSAPPAVSDSEPGPQPDVPKSPSHPQRIPAAGVPVHRGSAVAKLVIPRLDTTLYVVEGTDADDLKRGPGHVTGTALPGDGGNCVIAGHRDTHFRILKEIQDGDEILLERNGRTYRYRVSGMAVVSPDNLDSLKPSRSPVLHLITCFPFQYIGSAPKRFIVQAEPEKAPLSASR